MTFGCIVFHEFYWKDVMRRQRRCLSSYKKKCKQSGCNIPQLIYIYKPIRMLRNIGISTEVYTRCKKDPQAIDKVVSSPLDGERADGIKFTFEKLN
jgi:hypothetical protein